MLAVLNALKLDSAVLVGNSAAGHELTTLARQHPDRVAGLVYLDAFGEIDSDPALDPEWRALQQQLPPGAHARPALSTGRHLLLFAHRVSA